MLSGMKYAKPEVMDEVVKEQMIGHLGNSGALAAAVLWLGSPALRFVIGSDLVIDGGFTVQ